MFNNLLELIKEALLKMFKKTNSDNAEENKLIASLPQINNISLVSDRMRTKIDEWKLMYIDSLISTDADMSLGIPGLVCSELARSVLLEFESHISDNNNKKFDFEKDEPTTRAEFLEKTYQLRVVQKLRASLEYAMAVGGMVIKPYITGDTIYIDFCCQGEFVPLGFDDDGNITDIAFYATIVDGNNKYTKVERHYFNSAEKTVTIVNAAFVVKNTDAFSNLTELGKQIPLSDVPAWQNISKEPITITDVDRPLYGYYKFPRKNTADLDSPLGASAFARAEKVINYTNMQFGRLDFEYLAGSMAVDVDQSLMDTENPHGLIINLPEGRRRVFRGVDSVDGEMYQVFAPNLRDANYINGLNTYLMRIEDLTEISRGTLSDPNVEARTATEMLILKQRAYSNIADNQKALETALKDVIYSINKYTDLYGLFLNGDFNVTFDWDDSVITDRASQLEERITLADNGILSKAEVRAWYTGESLEEAANKIEEIESGTKTLDDIFTTPAIPNEPVIEGNKQGQTDEDIVD